MVAVFAKRMDQSDYHRGCSLLSTVFQSSVGRRNGIVLVAINPYRECDIYGENIFNLYRNANVRQLDPHVYGVAEEAFAYLTRHDRNQSIIISGESGAGKTVSAKYVMQYLAEACSVSLKERHCDKDVEKRVLASNPVTEAFGNAKTVRNDNSSRFGKFIKLLFSSQYSMCGATMETYLLEKSSTIYIADAPNNFRYLSKGKCLEVADVDDSLKFVETLKALRLNDDLLRQIFTILSAILHFGNVNFSSSSSDSCDISMGSDHFPIFCSLLEIDLTSLRHVLLHKTLRAGGEILNRHLDSVQAINGRDSLAKLIYSLVFSWLIDMINKCLHKNSGASNELESNLKFIGVLDIYGFEMFDKNSFEQLCINYANEMLQQQYNQHVFKLEQAEYIKEGIKWSFINFCDNQPCLDLFENRLGILDLLAQECKLSKASDVNFWSNMSSRTNDTCSKSAYFHLPRINIAPGQFIVRHFAGDVVYDVDGFIEKNVDSVNVDQVEVLRNSLFKQSLHELRRTLNATTPHYIRCIKPNDKKLPFNFCVLRTVEQLRACGVLETIRISASGFPSSGKYEFGHTKIFFRTGQVALLETARTEKLRKSAITVQKTVRGFLARKRYLRIISAVSTIQVFGKAWLCYRFDS
uniref:Myosin motor domain-containing protein n=1 Tax=Romanomermis culicivorax TaxID=13658 RepID=A0A915IU69_ROMCU